MIKIANGNYCTLCWQELKGEPITSFTGEYRFLSNFHTGHPVTYDGIAFTTAEHAFQYQKCLNDDDRQAVMSAVTPGAAKRAGRTAVIVPWWDDVKRRIMARIVTAKFTQHSDLTELLLATGNRDIVEGNTWGDTYWGVCDGVGSNFLGKSLMITRDYVRLLVE